MIINGKDVLVTDNVVVVYASGFKIATKYKVFGAKATIPVGFSGHTYAIPIWDENGKKASVKDLIKPVTELYKIVLASPETKFYITSMSVEHGAATKDSMWALFRQFVVLPNVDMSTRIKKKDLTIPINLNKAVCKEKAGYLVPGQEVVLSGYKLQYLRVSLNEKYPDKVFKFKDMGKGCINVKCIGVKNLGTVQKNVFALATNIYELLLSHPNKKLVKEACSKILFSLKYEKV